MAQLRFPQSRMHPEVHYVRAPQPIHFPEEEEVTEGFPHLVVRTFLFQLLRFALGPGHSVGSDQFVFWIASDPKRRLAPDVFVRLNTPQTNFGSWKTWECGGPPDLAIEIISPNEGDGVTWEEKLARYHAAGIKELVRFDPEAAAGARVRAWDRVENDLVERRVLEDRTPCVTLGLSWMVCPVDGTMLGLRLVDHEGRLLETREETDAKAREAETKACEAETQRADAESRARAVAEARVRELEEELRRRSS